MRRYRREREVSGYLIKMIGNRWPAVPYLARNLTRSDGYIVHFYSNKKQIAAPSPFLYKTNRATLSLAQRVS